MLLWIFSIMMILLFSLAVAMVVVLLRRSRSTKSYNNMVKNSIIRVKCIFKTVAIACLNNGVSMDNEKVYSVDYEMMGTP